ncbi:hypothetical protein [Phyllobacterium salinisoli]|uniref:hypothetical protein n=1 Tax=Phyllobacterium salinisoli TaxID=1899321 RepID=UPI00135CB871|nr:hypothetical protein [Phyllobacterium salinisoli]
MQYELNSAMQTLDLGVLMPVWAKHKLQSDTKPSTVADENGKAATPELGFP